MPRKRCFLHAIVDPNEEHYSNKRHSICMICAVKLWELGKAGLSFDMRGDTVTMDAGATGTRVVKLTDGHEINLAEEDGLEHLFQAIIVSTISRVKDTQELHGRRWGLVYDLCLCEVHYVAGQLQATGSALGIAELVDEFGVAWDMIAKRVNEKRGRTRKRRKD